MKTANLRFLLQKTIADQIAKEIKTNRDEVIEQLLELYDDTGSKSFVVKLPDGEKVATYTIVEPKPKEAVDEAALIEWLEENGYGDQVLTVEVPATTRKALKTGCLGAIGAELTDDGIYVTPAGEVVEGIEMQAPPAPSSFRVAYEGGDEGRARVIEAWKNGELESINPGDPLPQIPAPSPAAIDTTDETDEGGE